jgi:plastocyanin
VIEVKTRLTRRNVTAPVSVYQRGPVVKLGKAADDDPLAYERSHVVIYLEGPSPKADSAASASPPQIEQIDRQFSPDLLVVSVGATVSFPNMDPIYHNIFSLSKPRVFDLGSYDEGQTRTVEFPTPGVVEVYCHLHPNMAATIFVAPNRWYARADKSGQYRIAEVPPGRYTLVAWHKTAGSFRKTIVVEPGHDAVANFFIPIEANQELTTNAAAQR